MDDQIKAENDYMPETHHGSRKRVAWSVTRNTSTTLFGEDEAAARADYARRVKTLHRGETIRLERLVTAEAWVQHLDVIDSAEKVVTPPGLPTQPAANQEPGA